MALTRKLVYHVLNRVTSTYHCQEDAELGVHGDIISVREDEDGFALLLAQQHNGDLLGGYGQHREFDTVELVEATPGTGLGKT